MSRIQNFYVYLEKTVIFIYHEIPGYKKQWYPEILYNLNELGIKQLGIMLRKVSQKENK